MISRLRTFLPALTLAAAMASGAAAQGPVTSQTDVTTTIQDSAGIEVTGEVIFQDILINPQIPSDQVMNSSEGGANVTVIGGTAVSMAVPESFDLTREGGVETVTVLTMANGDYTTLNSLQGLLSSGQALSIDIGGSIRVQASQLASGEYRGLLVVVAQYD